VPSWIVWPCADLRANAAELCTEFWYVACVNVNVADVMGIDKARSRFSELIDRLPVGGPVLITRNGDPAAVMVDPEDYEAMVATLEVLGNPALRNEIEGALEDVASSRVELIPHEEVKRKLAARRTHGRDSLASQS
jgi:antitoxin YefM